MDFDHKATGKMEQLAVVVEAAVYAAMRKITFKSK